MSPTMICRLTENCRARDAALWTVGTVVRLEGRIQSRRYIKVTDRGAVEKTAFEVSVTEIEECVPENV